MIFSNFISGASRQPEQQQQQQQQQVSQQVAEQVTSSTEGATVRLKRLLQSSASRLVSYASSQELTAEVGEMIISDKQQANAQAQTPTAAAQTQARAQTRAQAQTPTQQRQRPQTKAAAAAAADWQLEQKYTLSEVQQHSSLDDCWMVIFDKVYNITEFVYEHPGGDFILLEYAGRDATHPFLSSRHGSSAYKMLDKYWIGVLIDEELYYSNKSSYCSAYSSLSWRSTPTLEVDQETTLHNNNNNNGTSTSDEDDDQVDLGVEEDAGALEPQVVAGPDLEAPPSSQIQLAGQVCEQLTLDTISSSSSSNISRIGTQVSQPNLNLDLNFNLNQQQQQQPRVVGSASPQQSQMLMIEYHKSYAPSTRRSFLIGESDEDEDEECSVSEEEEEEEENMTTTRTRTRLEKDEDADSDFGDEQRECNTCGGSSSAAALVASLASSATRPQAIVRSWSSNSQAATATAMAAQTTTSLFTDVDLTRTDSYSTAPAMSKSSFRWSRSSRWSRSRVTQQQQRQEFH